MPVIKNYLLAIELICLCGITYAQDARTTKLRWTSSESVELKSNASSQGVFEIHTSATEVKIVTGNQSKVFKIKSVTGQWSDITKNGSLSYQLLFGEKDGSGTLQRDNGVWYFTLDFSNHKDGIRQKFILSDFTVTQ